MNARVTKLELFPDEEISIKNELISTLELLWKRMTFKKDFNITGLICCTDRKREVTFVFNDRGRGSEANPALNVSKKKSFEMAKYGSYKRATLPERDMSVAQELVRRKLEAFFASKYPDYDFKANGYVLLFDGAVEVHLRMNKIRNIKIDDEVIVLKDEEDDDVMVVDVVEKSDDDDDDATEGQKTVDVELLEKEEPMQPLPALGDFNLPSLAKMNESDKLRVYLNRYLAVKPLIVVKKELPESPSSFLNRSLPIGEPGHSGSSLKRSATTRGTDNDDNNNERRKRQRSSLDSSEVDDDKTYGCQLCGESVVGKRNYFQHSKSKHGRVPCCLCGKTFTQKGNMERHMNSHTGNKPFACDLCHLSYTRLESLQSHKAKHH